MFVHRIYGAETWTLRKVDEKYLVSYKMWFLRRMEKISCKDCVINEEVCHRVKEERNILHAINRGKALLIIKLTRCTNLWAG